jgi:CheY-like chemotaxis protein
LATVTAVAIEQIQPLITSSRHQFSVDAPNAPLPVRGDQARLVQVVSNLLNNAAKYTPEGGYIDLRTVEEDGEWHLSVGDNGSGIAPDLMPEIFDLFTQGERTSDRRQGGLGLGLALVKSLVAMHGGRVTAESPGLGYGSRFHVYLPIAPFADLKAPPSAPALRLGKSVPSVHQLKLHLVDDNVDAAQTLAMLLEMDGYEVTVSYDGASTLAKVAELVTEQVRMPDVFILDIGLPDMDGTDLSRRLRDIPEAGRATLIALTGYGQGADVARSLAAGFDHHLVKPVDYERLTKLLAQLQSHHSLREPHEAV